MDIYAIGMIYGVQINKILGWYPLQIWCWDDKWWILGWYDDLRKLQISWYVKNNDWIWLNNVDTVMTLGWYMVSKWDSIGFPYDIEMGWYMVSKLTTIYWVLAPLYSNCLDDPKIGKRDSLTTSGLSHFIPCLNGLVEGKNSRKTPYLLGKSMVSCRFSLKPIHSMSSMSWLWNQMRRVGYDCEPLISVGMVEVWTPIFNQPPGGPHDFPKCIYICIYTYLYIYIYIYIYIWVNIYIYIYG